MSRWILDRRDFLKAGAAAVAGLALGCRHRLPHYAEPAVATAQMTPAPTPTPDPSTPVVRFGFVSDTHYADAPTNGTRVYRESLAKLREAVTELKKENLAFLLENGDFKDMAVGEPPETTLGYLTAIEKEFQQFGGPTYHTLGNHDLDNISKQQFQSAIANTGIDAAQTHYYFEHGGVRFIVLDACFKLDGSPYERGNFKSSESLIPDDQLTWLERTIDDAAGAVIVFVHQRVDEGEGGLFVSNSRTVRGVLENSGKVLAVFQGHDHKGDLQEVTGINYYTMRAMVEGSGPENNSYAVVEVARNGDITVKGFRKAAGAAIKTDNSALSI